MYPFEYMYREAIINFIIVNRKQSHISSLGQAGSANAASKGGVRDANERRF